MLEINHITVVKSKRVMNRHKLLNNVQKETYIRNEHVRIF